MAVQIADPQPAATQTGLKQERSSEAWTGVLIPLALILGLVLLLSFNIEPIREGGEAVASPLEPWLKLIVGYLASGAEIAAALVIGFGVVRGMGMYLRQLLAGTNRESGMGDSIRLQLGRTLALGLEFTIASDILRTAVAPTRHDIVNLAAIVVLRTLLNYFLEREIRQEEETRIASR